MAGLHVRRKGSDKPGFWYSQPEGIQKAVFIRDTLTSHCANCGREMVGELVYAIEPGAWEAVYGDTLSARPDGPCVEGGEPVDVAAIVK